MPNLASRSGHHGTRISSSLYESLILRRPLPVILGALLHIVIYLAFSLSGAVTPGQSLLRPAAHAWISIDVANSVPTAQSDVEFRQAWICGRWMQALDKHTLVHALDAQNYLLSQQQPHTTTTTILGHGGDTSPPVVTSNQGDDSPHAFAVHSILDGWGCSASAISSDADIPGTVSRQLYRQSSANITLHPASVFKGFSSSRRGLAADVVLITMMSKATSPAGQRWDESSTSLTTIHPAWHVLRDAQQPSYARVQYLATTSQDTAVIMGLYGVAALFAWLVLSRHPVLRSGLWLLASIAIEVALVTLLARHIFSSVEAAVSTVPLACYPLLPLAQCLFNVNHIISRVKHVYSYADRVKLLTLAMAEVGSAPCVRTLQALSSLLIILSLSPAAGLSSFCRFAMLSLSIDLLMFYTFFVSAFVINLRMPELQDTKSEQQQTAPTQKPPVWNMKLRWSTNHLLVTAGLLYFISSHFVDIRSLLSLNSFRNLRLYVLRESTFWYPHSRSYHGSPTGSILDWLRVQESETLREMLQAINMQASSFIVKSYPPLHVYTQPDMRNATRILEELPSSSITAMLPIAPFLFALIGFHSTYYGSSDASEDEKGEQSTTTDSSTSLIRRLDQRHTLDIYLLTSCAGRFMVSVGFDHQIWLWNMQTSPPTSEPILSTTEHQISWPISLVAVDDGGEWVAICSRRGQVLLWNRKLQSFGREVSLESEERPIKVYFLKTGGHSARLGPQRTEPVKKLLLVLDSGRLIDIDINGTGCDMVQICDRPIKSSHLVSINRYAAPKLITLTIDESIFMSSSRDGRWMTLPLRIAAIDNLKANLTNPIHFSMIPTLRGVASVYIERSSELLLVDILSGAIICTFATEPLRHQTLRVIHATPQQCIFCGSIAVASLTIAYTEKASGKFIMKTIAIPQSFGAEYFRSRLICLRSERDSRERRCLGFSSGEEMTYCMTEPGSWESTGANGVAGVRRVMVPPCGDVRGELHPGLWRRDVKGRTSGPTQSKKYRWEAWTMTAQGVKSTHELTTGLLAVTPGPLCRVGQNGIGVGLADGILLLQFGKQLRDDDGADGETDTPTHGKLAKRRSRSGFVPR